MQRAISEAIESAASPQTRAAILERALSRAGLTRPPEQGRELARFVEGALYDAIDERLGSIAASEVIEGLRPLLRFVLTPADRAPELHASPTNEPRPTVPVLDPGRFDDDPARPTRVPTDAPTMAPAPHDERSVDERSGEESSGVHVTPRPRAAQRGSHGAGDHDGHSTQPMPREPGPRLPAASLFVLATLDDVLAAEIEALEAVTVRRVRGLFELLDAAEEARERTTTLLYDCAQPPVHIASLLALGGDLPTALQVAVLGASALDLQAIHGAGDRSAGWLFFERPAPSAFAAMLTAAAHRLASTG